MYIEDFLEQYVKNIDFKNYNKSVLESINRQCLRGIGLTDRQKDLVVRLMLEANVENFTGNESTKIPLREIDRSKYAKIVDTSDTYGIDSVYESYKQNWTWLKIRFPFNKRIIVSLQDLLSKIPNAEYHHYKGSHEHFFKLTAYNTKIIMEKFLHNKDFEIQQELLDYYNQFDDICAEYNKENEKLIESYELEFGNKLMLMDKRIRYGIDIHYKLGNSLTENIASRSQPAVLVKPDLHTLDQLVESILQLDRFPLVVAIDSVDAEEQLNQVSRVYNAFRHVVDESQQSVLFRVDKSADYNLNNFIKDKNLNNWVDNNTKIVYINKIKLPKVLMTSSFSPVTSLYLSSDSARTNVELYITNNCDLNLYYDNELSTIKRYRASNGIMQTYY